MNSGAYLSAGRPVKPGALGTLSQYHNTLCVQLGRFDQLLHTQNHI